MMLDDADLAPAPPPPGEPPRDPPPPGGRIARTSVVYGLAALGIVAAARLAAAAAVFPSGWMPPLVFLLVAGYPVVLAAVWIHGQQRAEASPPSGRVRRPGTFAALGMAAGLACLLVAAWFGLRSGMEVPAETRLAADGPAPRIVVLPLIELDSRSDRYFAEGVTDELAAGLAAVEGIEVRGRASVVPFVDVNRDAASLGARFGGAVALDGTLRRSGGRLRLGVRLLDTSTGAVLWSMSRDTVRAALFDLRDEVVGGVADALGLELADATLRRLERRRTSPEALDLYLLGRFRWASGSRGDLLEAASYYHLAIEADSGFAPAWVALADAYATLPRFTRFPPERARREGAAAARTALRLEPDGAGAHAVLGEILYVYEHDWQGARSHLERARELDPGDAAPRDRLCELALALGDVDEARSACGAARSRDPLAFRPQWTAASLDRVSGDTAASLVSLDSLSRAHPDFEPLAADLVVARLVAGDTTAALAADLVRWFRLLGRSESGDDLAAAIAGAWSASAGSAASRRALGAVEAELDPAPAHMAALLVLFGERARGLEVASAALTERSPGALRFGTFPEYAELRRMERFDRLLSSAGMPVRRGEGNAASAAQAVDSSGRQVSARGSTRSPSASPSARSTR